jgi:23S rRNA (adenine2503-C2)-methyltransferase
MEAIGEKPYRARQVRAWIFSKGVSDFAQMTDLSKSFRETIAQKAVVTQITEVKRDVSADGTIKFLFGLADGNTIESVYMPGADRVTLCVSTQVGCKLNCKFCLTGKNGFARNLSAAEIVDQLIQVKNRVPGGRVTNLVLMGMGEPLENYDATVKALRIITEPDLNLIGARKITLSTAGVVPGILRLADDFSKVKLAVSLNATTNEKRSQIMPINKKHPIESLMATLKKWPLPHGRRITFEYVLLGGLNDSDADAAELCKITRMIPSKINLIPYNPCPGLPFERPSVERVEKFRSVLVKNHITATVRESRGSDILASCGQLRQAVKQG